jgi:cbb3-type cytochrome oxidase maturation protein
MSNLVYLIPIALLLGGIGLAAFLWSLRSGQYDDLDGAAMRILLDDPDDQPRRRRFQSTQSGNPPGNPMHSSRHDAPRSNRSDP